MREIKFRAWDKKNKKIRNNILLINSLFEYILTVEDVVISFDEVELMQYTGLKDKNGKEIYEGDIVKNTTQQVYLGQTYEVTWNENWACYQLMDNGLTSNIPLSQDFMSYEVIGNIYEDKEQEMTDRLEEFKIYINEQIELTRNLIDREHKISGITNHVLDLLKEVDEWEVTLFHIGMFEEQDND